jgi:methanethiol S-methyltransferase
MSELHAKLGCDGLAFPVGGQAAYPITKALSLLYAAASYLIFFGKFLYAVGFVGNFVVSKTIDNGSILSPVEAVSVNVLMLGLFAVHHSVMARPAFKRWWTRMVPPHVERSTYVLWSRLLLMLLFCQWRQLPEVEWEFKQSVAAAVWVLFGVGRSIVLIPTFLIDHFDLFGLRQAYLYARGDE